jgi:hypothetical protein
LDRPKGLDAAPIFITFAKRHSGVMFADDTKRHLET